MADELLVSLGINLQLLLAGCGGGFIGSFFMKKFRFCPTFASVIAGSLTANYLGGAIAEYYGMQKYVVPAGFVLGLSGLEVCKRIIVFFRNWTPFKQAKTDD